MMGNFSRPFCLWDHYKGRTLAAQGWDPASRHITPDPTDGFRSSAAAKVTALPFQPAVSEQTNLAFLSIYEVLCSPNESKFSLLSELGPWQAN